MRLVLCVSLSVVAIAAIYRLVGNSRRYRRESRDSLTLVFQPRELRELEARLARIAVEELRRIDVSVLRYVAGDVGYVVDVSESRHDIALGLSDGRRLSLGDVGYLTRSQLVRGAAKDKLRPTRVDRNGSSYRLLFRGEAGAEVEIYAPTVALVP